MGIDRLLVLRSIHHRNAHATRGSHLYSERRVVLVGGHLIATRGAREKPNQTRRNETTELVLKDTETGHLQRLYVCLGYTGDERIAEMFITVSKTGSYLKTAFEAWAILASLAIQYGMPVSKLAQSISTMKTGDYLIVEGPAWLKWKKCTSVWSAIGMVLDHG